MFAIATDTNKAKGGRPKVDTSPVLVRMSAEMLAAVDEWRLKQLTRPNRPEAIRRLVEIAINVETDRT